MVYFMLMDAPTKMVKIGRTANIEARMSHLANATPYNIKLLAFFEHLKEQDMHAMFKHLRIRREWFNYTDEIADFIKEQEKTYPNKAKQLNNKYNSINLPSAIYEALPGLSLAELKVLVVIARYSEDNNYARLSYSDFESESGLSRETVSNGISGLLDKNLIDRNDKYEYMICS